MPVKDKKAQEAEKEEENRLTWLLWQRDYAFWAASVLYQILITPTVGIAYWCISNYVGVVPIEDLFNPLKYSNYTIAVTLSFAFSIHVFRSFLTSFLFNPAEWFKQRVWPDPNKSGSQQKGRVKKEV